jgi:hypothetical protein
LPGIAPPALPVPGPGVGRGATHRGPTLAAASVRLPQAIRIDGADRVRPVRPSMRTDVSRTITCYSRTSTADRRNVLPGGSRATRLRLRAADVQVLPGPVCRKPSASSCARSRSSGQSGCGSRQPPPGHLALWLGQTHSGIVDAMNGFLILRKCDLGRCHTDTTAAILVGPAPWPVAGAAPPPN